MLQANPRFRATARPRAIVRWLWAVAALIVLMVAVGGITRLTESGLSITQWKPVTGIVPPLNEAQWQAEFARYRQIPEYQEINRGMTLDGFKQIYFWEYVHRVLGRLIGLAFAVPLLWFAIRRQIPFGYGRRLLALLALGALQGAAGWWMVTSGLSERTDVSHIRLAVHLMLALVILGGLVWTALDLRTFADNPMARAARLDRVGVLALTLLGVQIFWGALTAGLNAGYAFASWPLMGDGLYPAGVQHLAPWWRNGIDEPVTVQFIHRWLAFAAAGALVWLALRARARGGQRAAAAVVVLTAAQIALGIATLLSGVEITVAVVHQVNAALLLMAVVAAAHVTGRTPAS